jgi:hypothetical protein
VIIQTGPIYPHIPGTLPATPVLTAKGFVPPTQSTANFVSPVVRATKLHLFSPAFVAPTSSNDKLVEGLRTVTKLIAQQCGQKVALATNVVWLAVDSAAAYRTFRDPESSIAQRAVDAGDLTADALALLGGLLTSPHLGHAATAINFATLIGGQLHTGKIALTPSELAAFSTHPQAEDISSLLKLTEVLQPPGIP